VRVQRGKQVQSNNTHCVVSAVVFAVAFPVLSTLCLSVRVWPLWHCVPCACCVVLQASSVESPMRW
jgi:hypothetical protein